jgi:hypothetical protein
VKKLGIASTIAVSIKRRCAGGGGIASWAAALRRYQSQAGGSSAKWAAASAYRRVRMLRGEVAPDFNNAASVRK